MDKSIYVVTQNDISDMSVSAMNEIGQIRRFDDLPEKKRLVVFSREEALKAEHIKGDAYLVLKTWNRYDDEIGHFVYKGVNLETIWPIVQDLKAWEFYMKFLDMELCEDVGEFLKFFQWQFQGLIGASSAIKIGL